MISTQRALLPAVRLLSGARQALRLMVSRLPSPVQRRASTALQTLATRWPRLATILGVAPVRGGTTPIEPSDAVESRRMRASYLEDLGASSSFDVRLRAARALASIRDEETTAALAAALRDPSVEVAVEAAEALGSHRAESAILALRAALGNRDGYYSPMTRAASVRSLGALLPPDQGALLAAAVTDVDSTVSLAAIAALADRDDAASAAALTAVLEDRAGFYLPLTRQAAARGLLRLRRWDEDRFRALLESEYDATVREALVALRTAVAP